jgi:hypothetical protein
VQRPRDKAARDQRLVGLHEARTLISGLVQDEGLSLV